MPSVRSATLACRLLAARVYKGAGRGDRSAVETRHDEAPWPGIGLCVQADIEQILTKIYVALKLAREIWRTVEVAGIVLITRGCRDGEGEACSIKVSGVVPGVLGNQRYTTTVISGMSSWQTSTWVGRSRPVESIFAPDVGAGADREVQF